jgi:hypothetical protein
MHRIAVAAAVEPQRPRGERDFRPDETVRPVPTNRERVAEQPGGTVSRRPAEVHEVPARGAPGVELPISRERLPRRGVGRAGGPPQCRPPTAPGACRAKRGGSGARPSSATVGGDYVALQV